MGPGRITGRTARARRRGRVLTVAAATILLGACGAGGTSTGSPSTTARPPTTAAASARSTAPGPGLYASELPPCDPTDGSYTTAPDWVAGSLPAGMSVLVASTGVTTDSSDGTPIPTDWVLAEIDGDRLVSAITLARPAPPYERPGYDIDDRAPRVDSVRGRPGQIATWINRGDPVGQRVAEWTEDGTAWRATSPLDADALGAALGSLTLGGDRVEDPTGRFRVIGSGPEFQVGRSRVTQLEIDERARPDERARTYYVRIDSPVPGTTGITDTPLGPNATVSTVDGRLLFIAGSTAASTLADGSTVSISTYGRTSNPEPADPDAVRQILSGLRRRTPDDDHLVRTIPLVAASAAAVLDFESCREP